MPATTAAIGVGPYALPVCVTQHHPHLQVCAAAIHRPRQTGSWPIQAHCGFHLPACALQQQQQHQHVHFHHPYHHHQNPFTSAAPVSGSTCLPHPQFSLAAVTQLPAQQQAHQQFQHGTTNNSNNYSISHPSLPSSHHHQNHPNLTSSITTNNNLNLNNSPNNSNNHNGIHQTPVYQNMVSRGQNFFGANSGSASNSAGPVPTLQQQQSNVGQQFLSPAPINFQQQQPQQHLLAQNRLAGSHRLISVPAVHVVSLIRNRVMVGRESCSRIGDTTLQFDGIAQEYHSYL